MVFPFPHTKAGTCQPPHCLEVRSCTGADVNCHSHGIWDWRTHSKRQSRGKAEQAWPPLVFTTTYCSCAFLPAPITFWKWSSVLSMVCVCFCLKQTERENTLELKVMCPTNSYNFLVPKAQIEPQAICNDTKRIAELSFCCCLLVFA